MTTFFLIAGLFAHMMLARRGAVRLHQGSRDPHRRSAGGLLDRRSWPAIIAALVWTAAIRNGGSIPTDAAAAAADLTLDQPSP